MKENQSSGNGIKVVICGRVGYKEMLERQRNIFNQKVELKKRGEDSGEDILLCVEHNPVITLGRHAHGENVLYSEETLSRLGYERFEIERGGDVTYHGPGQLVVYPIIDLERYHLGVRDYVDALEESVIRTIAEYGIEGERVEGASGVWIGKGTDRERKICALGVKISRYVTMHGLALNVSTNLDSFNVINPCGFTDKGVTSILAETATSPTLEEVAEKLTSHLIGILTSRE